MIGQNIGTAYLMPYALHALEENPLAEGDFYPGDLLTSVVHIPQSYWDQHPKQLKRLEPLVRIAYTKLATNPDRDDVDDEILDELDSFLKKRAV